MARKKHCALIRRDTLERGNECIGIDLAQQRAHRLVVEHEEVFELEHLILDSLGEHFVLLRDLGHHALLDRAGRGVDDIGRLARTAEGERGAAMAFGDLLCEQGFEHGDGLGRDRAERGDAVYDLRLKAFGQGMEHGGRDIWIKLNQEGPPRVCGGLPCTSGTRAWG